MHVNHVDLYNLTSIALLWQIATLSADVKLFNKFTGISRQHAKRGGDMSNDQVILTRKAVILDNVNKIFYAFVFLLFLYSMLSGYVFALSKADDLEISFTMWVTASIVVHIFYWFVGSTGIWLAMCLPTIIYVKWRGKALEEAYVKRPETFFEWFIKISVGANTVFMLLVLIKNINILMSIGLWERGTFFFFLTLMWAVSSILLTSFLLIVERMWKKLTSPRVKTPPV